MGIPSFEEMKALRAGAEVERRQGYAADMAEVSILASLVAIKAIKLGISKEDMTQMFCEQWDICLAGRDNMMKAMEESDGHQQDSLSTVQAEPPSK